MSKDTQSINMWVRVWWRNGTSFYPWIQNWNHQNAIQQAFCLVASMTAITVAHMPVKTEDAMFSNDRMSGIKWNTSSKRAGYTADEKNRYPWVLNQRRLHISYSTATPDQGKSWMKEARKKISRLGVWRWRHFRPDWGTVKLDIDGTGYKNYQMAVFTAAKTNYRFAKLYVTGHTCISGIPCRLFRHCHVCISRTMVYDNMRVAVRKFVGSERERAHRSTDPVVTLLWLLLPLLKYLEWKWKRSCECSVEYVRRYLVDPGTMSSIRLRMQIHFYTENAWNWMPEISMRHDSGRTSRKWEKEPSSWSKLKRCKKKQRTRR